MKNIGYYLKEARNLFKLDLLSNIFSIFSIGLTLLILGIIISTLFIGSEFVDYIQDEAEINVYYEDDLNNAANIVNEIQDIQGIKDVRLVHEEEAYLRMEDVLGKEAQVLEYFEENPFKSFIEVQIDLDNMDMTIDSIEDIDGVVEIRDNRDILNRLKQIIKGLRILGLLMFLAVGISTIFVISHIIRQGIYNNRDEISTLRLLGASNSFIGMPFIMVGLLLTLGGGSFATGIIYVILKYIYENIQGVINTLPLPPYNAMISGIIILIIGLSTILGILGSLFGLSASVKRN